MLLSAENLSFSYPDTQTKAVDGVSLDIPEGAFIALCGLSGCGKSTLLRLLKPFLAPHGTFSGEIFFDGGRLSDMSARAAAQEIGFVAQDPESRIVTDRVWHEIAFAAESVGAESGDIRRRVAECAEYFGLERLFDKNTSSLSGGEMQLTALASAAVLHPRMLLLDEPTSQLDPLAAHAFFDALARLNRDFGVTVLIAEHRLEELLPLSDRLVVMEEGRIAADCPPRLAASALPGNHPMRSALPAALRVYAMARGSARSEAAEDGENAPLTVREGRANALCRRYMEQNPLPVRPPFAAEGKPVLSARELWVSVGGADVLRSASLDLYAGEVFLVLGGNGSGKSTLLKTLCGIIKPFGGRVSVKKGAKTAYLPQNPCELFRKESAAEELRLRAASADEALSAAKRVGLPTNEGFLTRNPLDLSGGERQLLAFAELLADSPDIMLLDEPTKGMDAAAKKRFAELLRGIAAQGTAIIAASHDVEFAERCADECGLLFNGEIAGEGAPSVFFGGNYFYTTPLGRLYKGISPVTKKDAR